MTIVLMILCTVLIKNFKEKQDYQNLYISEIVTANGSYTDEDGDYSDWIEIGYEGTEKIDLTGYYLSDKREEGFRWKFPEIELAPGEYLIVFASGKNKVTDSGELHTNFKLNAMGETVYLSDSEGMKIAEVTIPELAFDKSYGFTENEYVIFEKGSPKEKNLQEKSVRIKDTKARCVFCLQVCWWR